MYYCLDIGGSSIKVGILKENADILRKDTIPIGATFEEMIDNIVENLAMHQQTYACKGIAISAPGAVDTKTGIIHGASAIAYIHGPNWKETLQQRTGLPIAIENDANCAALAESHYGRAKDVQNMAFVVVGSGIGGALIYENHIVHGNHLHGGEIGYSIVGERNHQVISLSSGGSVGALVRNCQACGLPVANGVDVFHLASDGNPIAQEEIRLFYHYLAIGIFNLQYMYDPELILVAGAISSKEGFLTHIQDAIQEIIKVHDAANIVPKVVLATFKNDSNLLGALVHLQQEQNEYNNKKETV